jgi:hypothetical protein
MKLGLRSGALTLSVCLMGGCVPSSPPVGNGPYGAQVRDGELTVRFGRCGPAIPAKIVLSVVTVDGRELPQPRFESEAEFPGVVRTPWTALGSTDSVIMTISLTDESKGTEVSRRLAAFAFKDLQSGQPTGQRGRISDDRFSNFGIVDAATSTCVGRE